MKVERAIILAAGMSSRFAPLSYEKPKALLTVRNEVLIERQIRQLHQAGISSIYVVSGYQAEKFAYLQERFGVRLRYNPHFQTRNNHASIAVVKDVLENAYVCSSDHYFTQNPFQQEEEDSFYAAVYVAGRTNEWCLKTDESGTIRQIRIGGKHAWVMMGHTFWSKDFASAFMHILEKEYDLAATRPKLWESIYMEHLDQLHMKIKKYPAGMINEFDSLDELRSFDESYKVDTRSQIMKQISKTLSVAEEDINVMQTIKDDCGAVIGFSFFIRDTPLRVYSYQYQTGQIRKWELIR